MGTDNDSTNNSKTVSLTSLDARLDSIQAALHDLVKERRELAVLLMDMRRFLERRPGHFDEIPEDKQALLDMKRDYVSLYQSYARTQKRIDRLDARLDDIERRLDRIEGKRP